MLARNALAPRRYGRGSHYPFNDLQKEINDVFEGFWRGFDVEPTKGREVASSAFHPSVDISETDKSFEIRAELPGLDEKDVELTLADGTLTLKGEKKFEHEEKKADLHVSERTYGAFQRRFALPEDADPEKIVASFDNGVLTVTIAKSKKAQAQAKKISIKKG